MLRKIALALAAWLATCIVCGELMLAQVDWRGLALPGERKPIVYFPGLANERVDTLDTATGKMLIQRYYYNDPAAESGNRLYTFTYVDYAQGAFPCDSIALREAAFQETVAAAATSVQGEIIFSEPIVAATYPGWIFRIDYNEGSKSVYNEAYFIGDRYYHLQVFTIKGDDGSKSRQRFFDNFAPPSIASMRE